MGKPETSNRSDRRALVTSVLVGCLAWAGCSKGGGGGPSTDGGSDGSQERPAVLCSTLDASAAAEDAGGWTEGVDEFGPNAPAAKAASSLGRVNIYEVASPRLLERIDIYLRAELAHTRLTIAVQESPARTLPFRKLADVQIEFATCEGWASSGPLMIPLEAGRFYAIGVDPNQPITAFVNADSDTLPVDGAFGRLIGGKVATSVSVPTITWDKFSDKEYNRQRLATSPRDGGAPAGDGPTTADGGVTPADAARDSASPG